MTAMNNNPDLKEREFDEELKKLMEAGHLESPSSRFTEDVMEKVRVEAKMQNYRPVISKLGWFIVVFFILAVAVFALLSPASSPAPAWLTELTGYFNSGKLDVGLLASVTKFFNDLHTSGLLFPLTGLLLAIGFHGLVMKGFYFHHSNGVTGTSLF